MCVCVARGCVCACVWVSLLKGKKNRHTQNGQNDIMHTAMEGWQKSAKSAQIYEYDERYANL